MSFLTPQITFGQKLPGVTYKERPCAYALILEGQDIYLIRTGQGFYLPGGGIDRGESMEEALKRELIEETGFSIKTGAYLGSAIQYRYSNSKQSYLMKVGHFFLAHLQAKIVDAIEEDHHLIKVPLQSASTLLTQEFQQWAISVTKGIISPERDFLRQTPNLNAQFCLV